MVEGQHHFAFAQEVMALEVLEAEAGSASGVDLDHTRDPKALGLLQVDATGAAGACWATTIGCSAGPAAGTASARAFVAAAGA